MTDWRERFKRQNEYEAEGAAAGLSGKTRADCPYDQTAQSEAWNFWVYGNENAQGEQQLVASGEITWMSTAAPPHHIVGKEPLENAYRRGAWKPRYVTVPSSWHKSTLSST